MKGQYQKAFDFLECITEVAETKLDILYLKCYCLLKLNQYKKAIQQLNELITLDNKIEIS